MGGGRKNESRYKDEQESFSEKQVEPLRNMPLLLLSAPAVRTVQVNQTLASDSLLTVEWPHNIHVLYTLASTRKYFLLHVLNSVLIFSNCFLKLAFISFRLHR